MEHSRTFWNIPEQEKRSSWVDLVKRLRKRLLVPLQTSGNWFFGQPSWAWSISGAADDKQVLQMAGKYLRLHSVWSVTTPHLSYRPAYSVLLLIFRIQCNLILFKYTHFCFHFFLIFILFHLFLYLNFLLLVFFMFRDVSGSSGKGCA